MCLDFIDLNKAYPKDPFPIPQMSFLDAFQGYHKIPLALGDQEKTTFVTPTGNYHYKVMPFGLKNARSTYQRMMTMIFKSQLGKNIEVYIDDMVVKSKVVFEHVGDLEDTFEILRKHKLRLNASKWFFGVSLGKFLGYMVTHHGIEVNPKVRYLPLGKAILAVVHATRKLPHYFQLHTVVVLSSHSSLYSEVLIIQGGLPSGVRS